MDLFRVRLDCVDHYQSVPTKFDPILRKNVNPSQVDQEPKVPVIRVFGSTETGQKVCAHIHGAFPYLYVEYTGSLMPDEVGAYIHRLHLSIDYALAVSYRRNMQGGKAKFVARITIVKGIPFYGFHVGYRYYLKIYMLNPMMITRLADLLRQGVVMKKVFQPYEAHLQFLLQWMADYNLYGCGYIDCKKPTFRSPVPQYDNLKNPLHLWHDWSIPASSISNDGELPRVSHCSIEVDICVQDILNRQDVKPRQLHHDFIELLNPLTPDEKLVHSMAGLWKDETRRRKAQMSNPDPGSSPFPPDVMISMTADTRNSQPGGWIHEEEYREKVMELILDEKKKSDGSKVSLNSFVQKTPFESAIRTTLESVEDLYPENLRPALGLAPGTELQSVIYNSDDDNERGEVNEVGIIGLGIIEDEEYPYESDEDLMRDVMLSQRNYDDGSVGQQKDTKLGAVSSGNFENEDLPKPGLDSLRGLDRDLDSRDSPAGSIPSSFKPESSNSAVLDRDQSLERRVVKRSQEEQVEDMPSKRLKIDSINPAEAVLGEHPSTICLPKNVLGGLKAQVPEKDISRSSQSAENSAFKQPRLHPSFTNISPQSPIKGDHFQSNPILELSRTKDLLGISSWRKHVSFDPSSLPSSRETKKASSVLGQIGTATAQLSPFQTLAKRVEFLPNGTPALLLDIPPPSSLEVSSSMSSYNLPTVIYQDAYYSNEADVPERAREWAGREFKLECTTVPFLPDFDPTATSSATFGEKTGILLDKNKEEVTSQRRQRACGLRSWVIAEAPPTFQEVEAWIYAEESALRIPAPQVRLKSNSTIKLSQIDGPTQKNQNGSDFTPDPNKTSVRHEAQYMTTMSLEVHVNTRGTLVPNPEEDEIQCLFWCLQSDDHQLESNGVLEGTRVGIVVLSEDKATTEKIAKEVSFPVQEETSELDLMIRMVDIVRTYDPDILTGYEVHGRSWGYVIERARLKYDYDLCDEFSRMKAQSHGRFGKENDKWGFNNTSTIRVTGRHMINIWRAMRGELTLLQYTMENVVFHLLHRRIPHFTWADLTKWYTNGKPRDLAKVLNHYTRKVQLDLQILEKNELVQRTSEQARLLGVDFFSVFSRGSQYKVESLMFRIAKPENFLLVSPSRKQVGSQNALECLPLVMEPQSAFYNSPLLVLDFQSLYPSVMIAYNYCYSTFLGRIVNWRGTNKMGFSEFRRQQRLLELLKDHINIAPNGMMYTKPEIRKSLLAKMLGEILETRVMVKSGMKADKEDKILQRLLNNRQLALKLIANVTYGYTSASFSGRMPCSEIADSIVQTGRETLEKAIALIHSVRRWGAEVVYGDTDSIFVYLKGRTKDQAFDIGEEIAKTVTNMNPRPVKLKFEKVYFPCVLLAKKRYVGFKYEHRDQVKPEFDAKGIETVRRDGTPAEQKIEERALKLLFQTADLSQVKSYFQEQCEKIMRGSVSVQDFCFAREVKLGTYSDKGPPPPGALISTKRMLEDARAEPQYGERVPYVVITGAPGARLIDRCVAPEELLENDHMELDAEYYISKNLIPPLERIFNLVGANVRSWYDEMPKYQRVRRVDANVRPQGPPRDGLKKILESYMKSLSCVVCGEKLEGQESVCPKCLADRPVSALSLRTKLNNEEKRYMDIQRICQSCSGISPLDEVTCESKDCPVFYTRTRLKARLKMERGIMEPVLKKLTGSTADLGGLDW